MNFTWNNHRHIPFLLAGFGLVLGVIYFMNPGAANPSRAYGATGDNVSGFVWSGTIGWISLNSQNDASTIPYGVKVDTTTGVFSGYAWSENVGWISFNADAGTPPSGSMAKLDLATGEVTGWARALSAVDRTDGWDGWIKFSDDTNANWVGKGVKVDLITGKFSGYAWGSDVVGWVDFAPTIAVGTSNEAKVVFVETLPECTIDKVPVDGWESCLAITTNPECFPGALVDGKKLGRCVSGGVVQDTCQLTCPASGSLDASMMAGGAGAGGGASAGSAVGTGGSDPIHCGNKKCEANLLETVKTCPKDCKTNFFQF